MKIKRLLAFLTAFGYLLVTGCDDEISNVAVDEPLKNINGKWNVVQLTRNGEDLSQRLDLAGFSLNFNEDGTYSIGEPLPFVLVGDGTFRLNDPQYPFSLLMTSEGSAEEVAVKFQYPVVKGKRQLSLSFSLGCSGNIYQYNFERDN